MGSLLMRVDQTENFISSFFSIRGVCTNINLRQRIRHCVCAYIGMPLIFLFYSLQTAYNHTSYHTIKSSVLHVHPQMIELYSLLACYFCIQKLFVSFVYFFLKRRMDCKYLKKIEINMIIKTGAIFINLKEKLIQNLAFH